MRQINNSVPIKATTPPYIAAPASASPSKAKATTQTITEITICNTAIRCTLDFITASQRMISEVQRWKKREINVSLKDCQETTLGDFRLYILITFIHSKLEKLKQ